MSHQTVMGVIHAATPKMTHESNFDLLLECKSVIKDNIDLLNKEEKVEATETLKRINEEIVTVLLEGKG